MTFASKLGNFVLFVIFTIITLGLYPLYWSITMTMERNETLKNIEMNTRKFRSKK